MTGFKCLACSWLGSTPELRRELDKIDERAALYFVRSICPVCQGEELREVLLCETCLWRGVEVLATHDDWCLEHAAEQGWDFDLSQEGQFRRDRRTA